MALRLIASQNLFNIIFKYTQLEKTICIIHNQQVSQEKEIERQCSDLDIYEPQLKTSITVLILKKNIQII